MFREQGAVLNPQIGKAKPIYINKKQKTMLGTNTIPDNETYVIVRITNRTDFNFTPAMGAMYAGVPMPITAGKSLLAPKPAARHLAKHLARQVFIKKAPIRDEKEIDGKGSDRALWTSEDIERIMSRFLDEEYQEEKQAPKTEAEIMAQKVADLNKDFTDPESAPAPTENKAVFADKQEVIAELEKRGIKHDKRSNKEKLEALLK